MTVSIKGGEILAALEKAGFEAYYVGGCVRDLIMGREIHDTDITTSALPEETTAVFSGYKVIPNGIKHGTVTVICDGESYEITTFRQDGSYSDSRRPDIVTFSRSIEEDLARRDLSINAIAMDICGNIVDPFGGRDDIANRVIRCVGDPEKRFTEDALRILRAARFAAQLGFRIEPETAVAMHSLRGRLDLISRERVRDELDKLVCGRYCTDVLLEFRDIIGEIIPEMIPCFDFEQHSKYHKYDVYGHIVRTVSAAPEDNLLLRRAMLFHDIGKPPMFTVDEKGEGHFKGHAPLSAEIARDVMKRLHYDSHTIDLTCTLISLHSDRVSSERHLRRLVSRLGADNFALLMEFMKADNLGKNEFVEEENPGYDALVVKARELAAKNACPQLSGLAVNGNDMLALGLEGRAVGDALRTLHQLVTDGDLPNEKDVLIDYARRLVR